MPMSYGSRKGQKVDWIVLHYPVAPGCNAKWCYDYYNKPNVTKSAHFAVDENSVVSIVPCDLAAFHCSTGGKVVYCGANNLNSIGIDLMDRKISCKTKSVCDCDWYIPENTLDLAADFIARLIGIYKIPLDHVVRHYDVTHKACPRPLCGDDVNQYYGISGNQKWNKFKTKIEEFLFFFDADVVQL